jgi:hypothetical protein
MIRDRIVSMFAFGFHSRTPPRLWVKNVKTQHSNWMLLDRYLIVNRNVELASARSAVPRSRTVCSMVRTQTMQVGEKRIECRCIKARTLREVRVESVWVLLTSPRSGISHSRCYTCNSFEPVTK